MGRVASNRERRRYSITNATRHGTTTTTRASQSGNSNESTDTHSQNTQDSQMCMADSTGIHHNLVFSPAEPTSEIKPYDKRRVQSVDGGRPYLPTHTPVPMKSSFLSATRKQSSMPLYRNPRIRRTSYPHPKSRVKSKRRKVSVNDAMDLDEPLTSVRDLDVHMKSDEPRSFQVRNHVARAPQVPLLEDVDMENPMGWRWHNQHALIQRVQHLETQLQELREENQIFQSYSIQSLLRFVQVWSPSPRMTQAGLEAR